MNWFDRMDAALDAVDDVLGKTIDDHLAEVRKERRNSLISAITYGIAALVFFVACFFSRNTTQLIVEIVCTVCNVAFTIVWYRLYQQYGRLVEGAIALKASHKATKIWEVSEYGYDDQAQR